MSRGKPSIKIAFRPSLEISLLAKANCASRTACSLCLKPPSRLALISLALVSYDIILILLPLIILIFPLLLVYAKSLENLMTVLIDSRKATVGDWLVQKVKIQNKLIKPYWEGLSEEEVKLLASSRKKIKIKQGIPFVPGFLIALILFIFFKDYFSFLALW